MRKSSWAAVAMFVGSFVINPALFSGCNRGFAFGETEMVALLESVNEPARWTFSHDGVEHELVLKLEQEQGSDVTKDARVHSVTRVAYACDNRSFLRSAGACLDTTELPLAGKLTLRRLGAAPKTLLEDVSFKGELSVNGTRLDNATLVLEAADDLVRLDSKDGKSFALSLVKVGALELKP